MPKLGRCDSPHDDGRSGCAARAVAASARCGHPRDVEQARVGAPSPLRRRSHHRKPGHWKRTAGAQPALAKQLICFGLLFAFASGPS
eukprot:5494729-Pleurochrysis_carterae.AAC.1